jgi:hypothetical protein
MSEDLEKNLIEKGSASDSEESSGSIQTRKKRNLSMSSRGARKFNLEELT